MRLLRVRFTTGMLLSVIAVVAANCMCLRQLDGMGHAHLARSFWYGCLAVEVGVLPLANVALIGTLLSAARWLPSTLHGRTGHRQSSLSAVTYFSLNILILGGLVSRFMPEAIPREVEICEAATGYAARGWLYVFGEPRNTVAWAIFNGSILGLLISGPPLLLCWIGHLLARRCTATLPWRRCRAVTCLVSFGFASAALAICLTPQPFEEDQEVPLDFQVVDEVSGRPIAGAFVCMTDPFSRDSSPNPPRAFTDADGCARLTDGFIARGERNAFQTCGIFSSWGRWLEVSAEGHCTRRIPLPELLGSFSDPARQGVCEVRLTQGETPRNPLRCIAGSYSTGGGFGGCWLKIEPDGRFAFCEWGCTYRSEEYGYLTLNDGTIELSTIPHPGREVDPAVISKVPSDQMGGPPLSLHRGRARALGILPGSFDSEPPVKVPCHIYALPPRFGSRQAASGTASVAAEGLGELPDRRDEPPQPRRAPETRAQLPHAEAFLRWEVRLCESPGPNYRGTGAMALCRIETEIRAKILMRRVFQRQGRSVVIPLLNNP